MTLADYFSVMASPLVSIIIPVFNSKPYLHRCLDSVIEQRFEEMVEILLVDDGSTDGSAAICDEYARNYALISVFHTGNRGASLARRWGLERARGEYVTFVDSDDFISSNYLSSLYDLEKRFNLGISACAVQQIQPGEIPKDSSSIVHSEILDGDELFHRFFKYEFWGLYGKLYRKQLVMSIPFPKATLCEDYYVTARLFHLVKRIAYSSEPLYYYEEHAGSLSRGAFSLRSFEEFDNVLDVYLLTAAEMPAFRLNALSNAIETAVKLLWASRQARAFYQDQRRKLKAFLAEHRKDLLACPNLFSKTKALALLLSL